MKRIEKLIKDGDYQYFASRNAFLFTNVLCEPDETEEITNWFLEELPEPQKLTTLEFELAKYSIKRGYKWISRDEDGMLYTFSHTPYKEISVWHSHRDGEWLELPEFEELFSFVKWTDDEPTNLQELIDNCVVVEQ